MRARFSRLGATLLTLAVLGAAGWTLQVAAPRAGATAGPTVTADPATALVDGQFVKLTFAGFAPGVGIVFRQCIATPTLVGTDCTAVNQHVTGVTDATGGGSTYLPVYAGSDPLLKTAGGPASIVCDAQHACSIAAMLDPTNLATAVVVPLSFAPSPDACPPPGPDALLGGGSSSAYRAVYAWSSTVCRPPVSLSVGYTVSNSPDGITSFFNGLTDFAVTGPLPPVSPPATLTYKYAPLTASALVLAYRIYDRSGVQVTSLTLTPKQIARIFLGEIPNWNGDRGIKGLNKGIHFPGRIVPFVRAEHDAETYTFTSWLAATAPTDYTAGPQAIFPIPATGVNGVTGSTGVGLAVVDPTTDFFDQGNIGFMDASTAAFYGLPTAHIRMAKDHVADATPASIAAALKNAPLNSDGTVAPNYATPDPPAYPMPIVSYMLAPTNTIDYQRGAALADFLRYAVQTGQTALPAGYAPLPQGLVQESLAVATQIPAVAPPPPPPATPAPTPAPTPPPTPAPLPLLVAPPPPAAVLPSATPLAVATPTAAPAPTPTPAARKPVHLPVTGEVPGDQADRLLLLAQPATSRLLLPAAAGVAVLCLLLGIAAQAAAGRRPADILAWWYGVVSALRQDGGGWGGR